MSTPNFIFAAIDSFLNKGNPEPLKNLFQNNMLTKYPESCDLILKILDNRKLPNYIKAYDKERALRNDDDFQKEELDKQIQKDYKQSRISSAKMMFAELHAAGMQRYAEQVDHKNTAAHQVERLYHVSGKNDGFSARKFYEKYKNDPEVLRQTKIIKKLITTGVVDKTLLVQVYKNMNDLNTRED